MGRAGPGKARGGEGLVLDKRPGTGLELDVGEGKPLAPLRLSRLGASGSKLRPTKFNSVAPNNTANLSDGNTSSSLLVKCLFPLKVITDI